MTRRDPSAYVWDLLDAARSIETILNGRDMSAFLGDRVVQLAVERLLIIVGEAATRLGASSAELAAELGEVGKIVGFRNVLVHGYFKVDYERVWQVVKQDVPRLIANAERVWSRFAPLYPPSDQPGQ